LDFVALIALIDKLIEVANPLRLVIEPLEGGQSTILQDLFHDEGLFRKKSDWLRHGGGVTLGRRYIRVGKIEDPEPRKQVVAINDSIDRAAIGVTLLVSCLRRLSRSTGRPPKEWSRLPATNRSVSRIDSKSSRRRFVFASRRLSGSNFSWRRFVIALLLVDAGKHQHACSFLSDQPSCINRPSEVVQQFGMARWIGAQPKIVGK